MKRRFFLSSLLAPFIPKPVYHPLIAVSPMYACGAAAIASLAPPIEMGRLDPETAARLQKHWDAAFNPAMPTKIVLSDGCDWKWNYGD